MNGVFQLTGYQEQAYLLDPYLEQLVTPVIEVLKTYAKAQVATPSRQPADLRIFRLGLLLHQYIKFRGAKTIGPSASFSVLEMPTRLMLLLITCPCCLKSGSSPMRSTISLWH